MFETIQDKNTLKILTPGLKNRKTAKIKLKNGLQVYLVSDPDADKSAASLAMQVGSWQDPQAYPGMAHFCEHLLFLGTKTYPKEEYFQSSVKDNGGTYNAYTAADQTVYMFTANHKAFSKILDQFAHFFIDPAFNPSGVQRELHAVDQESDMYYEHDFWRFWMVFKEMGNPNHPNALFNVGNSETLKNIPVAKVKNWYQNHYSAHKANLVLYAPLPIEQLTKMAVSYFSKMPNQAIDPTSPYLGTISSATQKAHITYIKPIKDIRTLTLTWELPTTYSTVANKVPDLVAYVINNKENNSLYSQLKEDNLAENIQADVERMGDVAIFSITITFIKNKKPLPIERAIHLCFEAIAGLQTTGMPRYLFEEMCSKAKMKYAYQGRVDAFGFVMSCASQLVNESLATYPLQTLLPTDYKASDYKNMLNLLTPRDCMFTIMAPAKQTGMAYDKKERWYGAEYNVQPIPQDKLEAWGQVAKHPKIGLPAENPFTPTNLTLKHNDQATPSSTKPLLLENSTQGKAFFYPGSHYQVPHISWIFKVKSPLMDGSPKQTILLDLYVKILQEAFATEQQQSMQVGLFCSLYQKNLGFHCKINGYNDKAPLLLETLLDKLTTYLPSKEQFVIQHAALVRECENFNKSAPQRQAYYMLANLLNNITPTCEEFLAILPSISYEEFCNFSKELFQTTYVEAFFSGNLTKHEALNNWHNIKKRLSKHPYPIAVHHVKKLLVLPKDSGPYKISKKISAQGHAMRVLFQAGDFSFEKNASMKILGKAFKDGYFKTLRTKQQIAYSISTTTHEIAGQLIHIFDIQSSTHTPEELLIRTETFIEDYVKDFTAHLSEARFETIRTQLITSLTTPPPNLVGMSDQLNHLAFEYDGDFDRINKQISALREITYAQVKAYAFDLASRQNRRRAACLLQGVAPKGKDFEYQAVDSDKLKSLGTYVQKKKSSKL